MRRTATIEKRVGETPLQALERFREMHPELAAKNPPPLAYAGRLDPMASGKLLILIGEECKRQTHYHGLDKRYEVTVLFGTGSDTGDVLGILSPGAEVTITSAALRAALAGLSGQVALPYPHFSSKTVQGKPLHVWTLEGRLDEIEIPVAHTTIYSAKLQSIETRPAAAVYEAALAKVNSLPPVQEPSKALGADFRRDAVRQSWNEWLQSHRDQSVTLANLSVTCSSGTYMRSLAGALGGQLGTTALAFSIHRTHIGRYWPWVGVFGRRF
jgi:tRNA pseudouridine55 synthase